VEEEEEEEASACCHLLENCAEVRDEFLELMDNLEGAHSALHVYMPARCNLSAVPPHEKLLEAFHMFQNFAEEEEDEEA
jgi:hypothetical protein